MLHGNESVMKPPEIFTCFSSLIWLRTDSQIHRKVCLYNFSHTGGFEKICLSLMVY